MQQDPNAATPFTLKELIWHDEFRRWVLSPTPELTDYWTDWLARHPDRTDTLSQAREVVLALRVSERPITDADIQQVIAITQQHLDRPAPAVAVRPLRSRWYWAAAASLVLLAGLGMHYWWSSQSGWHLAPAPAGLISSSTAAQTIRLDDGSTVQLAAGSQLRYPAQFTAPRREVYLTGTATFSVVRKPDQPFLVHANGSVTRVLGTRFTVLAPQGGNRVTVKVLSGSVSVLPESEWVRAQAQQRYKPRTVMVTPNQQVVFEPVRELMQKSLVAAPVLQQAVLPSQFNFTAAPVAQVFNTLEKAYGIPIVFDAEALRHCLVTAPLADEPLLDKLDIICETIGARYEIVEAQIVIAGRGCTP